MTQTSTFTRDRLTWLAYAMLAYVGLMQALLGPILPSLRQDMQLDYTQSSLISSASAIGMIAMGALTATLARHLGRTTMLWGGALGIAVTIILLTLAGNYPLLLASLFLLGAVGSITQTMVQAILSDHHGEQRAISLSEANVGASLFSLLPPLLLGLLARLGLPWQYIAWLYLLALALLALVFRLQKVPNRVAPVASAAHGHTAPGKLPAAFWGHAIVLLFIVASEMSLFLWSASFLIEKYKMDPGFAVMAFSLYPFSQVLARLAGSRLTMRFSASALQTASFLLAIAGMPLLWLGGNPVVGLVGLFVTGVGVANLFPLTMSAAVGASGHLSDLASARISMIVGVALFSSPFALGWLADRVGLANAYGLILGLLCTGLLIKLVVASATRRAALPAGDGGVAK